MVTRLERLAENQQMAREANDRLRDVVEPMVADGRLIPFLCECADDGCLGRIDLTTEDYFIAHLNSDYYILLPDHPRLDGEELVEDHGAYEVLSKAAA
jgi:hypothetical protein